MRILFLCKRRYMNKDVILERYARMYEIPHQLARLGHQVHVQCLSYHAIADGEWDEDAAPGTLHWGSTQLGTLILPGLARYAQRLQAEARAFRPQLVYGGSDIPHAVAAAWLAKRLRVPCAIDLYDNFESYGQARLPGAVAALRRALRAASLVSSVSDVLSEHVRAVCRARGQVVTVRSTVDRALFKPADRAAARRALGLPAEGVLIGTAGTLFREKGVGVLYEAFAQLAPRHPQLQLCLAGPTDPAMPPPQDARVHYLGRLPHTEVPRLFAALDLGVVCIRNDAFGRYSFPQKAYEMLASGIPIVAADVGDIRSVLSATPSALHRPDDAGDLARAITAQLQAPATTLPIPDWAEVMRPLQAALLALADPAPGTIAAEGT